MRPPLLAAIAAIALIGACSRSDDHKAADDVKGAGHSIDSAAASLAHNPDVKSAEADLKKAGHDAAKDFRKAEAEAKAAAHKVASDTRGAAHDVSHDDHHVDDKSS
ncbi:MAG TPA: hypothetical protein VKQ70_15955 [Caulobacteraceae bacterium]|jgi:hypothetical protein|nr:hypothetical protein [Caulobacteraceae bacterium]